MPSPFDDPHSHRHGRSRRRHHHHNERAPAVEVKPDYVVWGIWAALFVLFMTGAVSALLR
jgi:hypothetical protein